MATLDDWLTRLEGAHPRVIDLGLQRVGAVWERLGKPRPAPLCVVVGGTNGKGSTVAFVEACLRAGGHRVGAYTSPHLLKYNERVRIDGLDVVDADLIAAFERVETARAEISLSYFEFGTLVALLILAQAGLDAAVLEIGLGGRLDAVNLIDSDVAVLTSVDLDHQEYLGDSREQIGWEKAHIFRRGRPAVIAEPDPPASVITLAAQWQIDCLRVPQPVAADMQPGHWRCTLPDGSALTLPDPALAAPCQRRNAAAAVYALWSVRQRWAYSEKALGEGVRTARVRGRLERLSGVPETWVDVAHNPEAARVLAQWLQMQPRCATVAVFAALGDKDLAGIVQPLSAAFTHWILVDLRSSSPRGLAPEELARHLRPLLAPAITLQTSEQMPAALALARRHAGIGGRIIVFGSFHTVAEALRSG